MLGRCFLLVHGEVLEWIPQKSCGCPIPKGVQGSVGWVPPAQAAQGDSQPMAGELQLDVTVPSNSSPFYEKKEEEY